MSAGARAGTGVEFLSFCFHRVFRAPPCAPPGIEPVVHPHRFLPPPGPPPHVPPTLAPPRLATISLAGGVSAGFPCRRDRAVCGATVSLAPQPLWPWSRAANPFAPTRHPGVARRSRDAGPLVFPAWPLSGVPDRRRPPGEPFSRNDFPLIPVLCTSSTPPWTMSVTPVTNFVTIPPGPWPLIAGTRHPSGRCTTATPSPRKSPSHMVRKAHPTYKQPLTHGRG